MFGVFFALLVLRVPVARCANTGLTFFVDPWGRVLDPLPIFEDAVRVAPLPGPAPAAKTAASGRLFLEMKLW